MKLNLLTLTGADDTVDHNGIYDLSKEYPFVEWGILLSKSSQNSNRFPSKEWITELINCGYNLNTCGHICGRWVRDICKGNWSFLEEHPEYSHFSRFQLNFHAYVHQIEDVNKFVEGFKHPSLSEKQFIFQLDNINDDILDIAMLNDINAVGLFDTSGGVGVLPEKWASSKWDYCGYAGGLGPHNLEEQLVILDQIVGDKTVWVDMETHIRNESDYFDYEKCRQCLEISLRWV